MTSGLSLFAFAFFSIALMNTILLTMLGTGLVLLVAYDVYATILHARARSGPIGETLNRIVWRSMRARRFPPPAPASSSSAQRCRPTAAAAALIIIYLLLLVSGFALIYYPRMPEQFAVAPEAMSTPAVAALYFSGITLTTVGYGDIAPHTTLMRFVALVESASGFALISLAVTYLITVYSALERKRAVALSFYHQAEEGADVAGFIAHHFVAGPLLRTGSDAAAGDARHSGTARIARRAPGHPLFSSGRSLQEPAAHALSGAGNAAL